MFCPIVYMTYIEKTSQHKLPKSIDMTLNIFIDNKETQQL